MLKIMEMVFPSILKFTHVTIKVIQLNHILGSDIEIIPISVTHMFKRTSLDIETSTQFYK